MPRSPTRLGRIRDRAADPATWKDLAYLWLLMPLGLVSFTLVVCTAGTAIGLLTMPAWSWSIGGGVDVGLLHVDGPLESFLVVPLAPLVWLLFLLAVRGLVALHGGFARALLTASPDPVLAARVSALQDSRARIIAAADAERRRLERDLHDGAQQRLVAMSMSLGMARRRLAKGEDIGELVAGAEHELHAAISELRDLARGIHPAVLTDRGLAPAVRDLAQRSQVPVELGELPEERLPGPVEAAAFFTVSEALTNVAKYAGATAARVDLRTAGERLEIVVDDDGVGGAVEEGGSGLRGLADRLGALGGELGVVSPRGEGTRLRASIPLAQPEHDPLAPAPAPAARSRRAPPPLAAVARRRLRARDGAAGVHLADHGRRLLLAAVADRGLGTGAGAARLVRARAPQGYARRGDATRPMRGGMGAKKKAAKAGAAAAAVKRSPYVRRIAEDQELRQNLWSAYESARAAVGRIQNGKHPTKQIFDDKRLQKDLKSAAESFKDASVAIRQAPKRKRKGRLGKLILLGIVGGGLALAVSEDLRKKLLDALFGAEEEFEYTSTTAPATPASTSETAGSTS